MTVGSCGIRCSRSGLRRISLSAPTADSCGYLHQFQCFFFRRDLKYAMPKKGASIETCFSPVPALALSKTSVPPVSRPTGSEGHFFSGRHTCGEQEKNAADQQHPDLRRTGQALRRKIWCKAASEVLKNL